MMRREAGDAGAGLPEPSRRGRTAGAAVAVGALKIRVTEPKLEQKPLKKHIVLVGQT
jgi:hypothetical protein